MVGDPVADAFGARPEGNWEGTNVLWLPDAVETVAARHRVEPVTLAQAIDDGRKVLLERRRQRAQPAIDDKVVAAWNGLAIGALAIAGRAFKIQRYLDAATASATFVWSSMRDAEGRLARSWRGTSSGPGFLDDHALLTLGLLTLFETTGGSPMVRARAVADRGDRPAVRRSHGRLPPDRCRRGHLDHAAEGSAGHRDPERERRRLRTRSSGSPATSATRAPRTRPRGPRPRGSRRRHPSDRVRSRPLRGRHAHRARRWRSRSSGTPTRTKRKH